MDRGMKKLFQRLKELHGDLEIGRDTRAVLQMLLVELGSFVKSAAKPRVNGAKKTAKKPASPRTAG